METWHLPASGTHSTSVNLLQAGSKFVSDSNQLAEALGIDILLARPLPILDALGWTTSPGRNSAITQ
jgi:hypothetical protein